MIIFLRTNPVSNQVTPALVFKAIDDRLEERRFSWYL